MSTSIGGINSPYSDSAYLIILQELMKLGIVPSGNKNTDKSKSEKAKTEFIVNIQIKQQEEEKQDLQVQPLEAVQDTQRAQLEALKPGAMTIAELNKLYFRL